MSVPAPEVSVILPTCDRPQLVRLAVASVRAQTFPDFELLLIDNNRTTPPVQDNPGLQESLRDPRVRVITAPTARNAGMARNAGLTAARGRWITFLDDDDTYRADKIAAQHALAQETGAALVVCGFELIWPGRRRERQVDRKQFCGDEILTHATLGSPMLFHVRDDTVRFDARLSAGEDMLYALQIGWKHGETRLPCVPRPLVIVTQQSGENSVHSNKESVWRAYRLTCFAARGHFSRSARRAFLARGKVDRALGGHGGVRYLSRSVLALLQTRAPRKWRTAAYVLLARLRALGA